MTPREPGRATLLVVGVAVLTSLAVLLTAGCESSEHEAGLDLERMVDQRRFDAYDATDLFADGTVMRTPPEGTVPFDEALSGPVRTGREDGAPVTGIPVPVTSGLVREGRRSFDVYCAPCHGEDGNAATPVAAVMELRPPPALHSDRLREMAPGELFGVVTEGYGMMPGYATSLEARERWAVVAYVRALQLSRRLPLDSLPPATRERILERLSAADSGEGGGS